LCVPTAKGTSATFLKASASLPKTPATASIRFPSGLYPGSEPLLAEEK